MVQITRGRLVSSPLAWLTLVDQFVKSCAAFEERDIGHLLQCEAELALQRRVGGGVQPTAAMS